MRFFPCLLPSATSFRGYTPSPRHPPRFPPPASPFPPPYAAQDRDRDADPALFVQHAHSDRGRSHPDQDPITPKTRPRIISLTFYKTFDDIRDQKYDGFIITGAPIELMPFEEVEYWDELVEIMEWTKTHVHSTLHICWGAQAGLYHHYGIQKYLLPKNVRHFPPSRSLPEGAAHARLTTTFCAPHSRHTEVRADDIRKHSELRLLAESHEAGVYIIEAVNGRQIFMLGHGEYDSDTLKKSTSATSRRV